MKMKRWIAFLAAVCILFSAGCAKGGEDSAATNDPNAEVTLKWYVPCATQEDNGMVYEAANKIIKEKINAEVEFIPVEFGSYDQKLQVINAGRDEYDISFTSNWLNNYYQNVEKGNIIALDELLPEYAPELYQQIDQKFWDGVRVQGKIYGVINQQILAREGGWSVPEKFAQEFNYDVSQIVTLEDVEEWIRLVQSKYPECNTLPASIWPTYAQMVGIEEFLGESAPSAIRYNEEGKPVVFNQFLSDEFKEYIQTRKKWNEEGLTQKVLVEPENAVEQYKNDQIITPIGAMNTYKPGLEDETEAQTKVRPVFNRIGGALLTTSGAAASLNSIADTSKNPERTMMLLNLVNTDKELYNLLSFGIEGRHYTKLSDTRIELSEENRYIVANWAIGSVYNSYLYGNQADTTWEETKEINNNATISPIYGFAPNLTPVNVQLTNCKTAVKEYLDTLDQGVGDTDDLYPKFIQKLEDAGVQEVIDEMQKQIDEWYEANGK